MRYAVAVALASLVGAAPAHAQTHKAWSVCGGNTFNTCASVDLQVVGTSVTVKIWNLSGYYGTNTFAGTVFTGIGFENVGSVDAVANSLTMSGPTRSGDHPLAWVIKNDKQIGGGVKLDIVGQTINGSVDNSISSRCADNAMLPGGSNQLWQSPCHPPTGLSDPGWVTLQFNVTGTWNLSTTYLLVKGQNGPGGQSTECITGGSQLNCTPATWQVVPEPMTIVLLGSGMAGMGGMGMLRRRRRSPSGAEADSPQV